MFVALTLFVFHDYYLDQDCTAFEDKKECSLFQQCDIDKDGCLDHTCFHIMISVIEILPPMYFITEYFTSYTFRHLQLDTHIYPINKPPIFIS